MQKQIFREKAIDQLSAPEQLNDYLRVTSPGIWFLLVGIIVLLAGLLVWGALGTIRTTVKVPALVSDGTAECYILESDAHFTGDEVSILIGDQQLTANTADSSSRTLGSSEDQELFASGYLEPGRNVVILTSKTSLQYGIYEAEVTTEVLNPISLLFAKN